MEREGEEGKGGLGLEGEDEERNRGIGVEREVSHAIILRNIFQLIERIRNNLSVSTYFFCD